MVSMQEKIENKLFDALSPTYLKVENQSYKHAGHAGDDGSGESHFSVDVVSNSFQGLSRVACQKLVFKVLEEEMKTIHALSFSRCSINT